MGDLAVIARRWALLTALSLGTLAGCTGSSVVGGPTDAATDAGAADVPDAPCVTGFSECSGVCRDLQSDNAHCGACSNACPAGQVCARGVCAVTCGAGFTECSGACRDLQSDLAHCGACGNACPAGQVCSMGACRVDCALGLTNCGGVCRDTTTDLGNCGACGRPAPRAPSARTARAW
ncbi:MAG: MXAN_6577-like cysteine-rich protein [Polyangiales bacterium]